MNTLVLYDAEGYVFHTITGSFREPVGIPYIIVEVPEGKRVAAVDTENDNTPIFEDLQTPTINQLLSKLNQQEEMTVELEAALYDIALVLDQLMNGSEE